MSNGKIDDATVTALLKAAENGNRKEIDKFLVTSVIEMRNTLDDVCDRQSLARSVLRHYVIPVLVSVSATIGALFATGVLG